MSVLSPLPVNRVVNLLSADKINGTLLNFQIEFESAIKTLYVTGQVVGGSPTASIDFTLVQNVMAGAQMVSSDCAGQVAVASDLVVATSGDSGTHRKFSSNIAYDGLGIFGLTVSPHGSLLIVNLSVLGVA